MAEHHLIDDLDPLLKYILEQTKSGYVGLVPNEFTQGTGNPNVNAGAATSGIIPSPGSWWHNTGGATSNRANSTTRISHTNGDPRIIPGTRPTGRLALQGSNYLVTSQSSSYMPVVSLQTDSNVDPITGGNDINWTATTHSPYSDGHCIMGLIKFPQLNSGAAQYPSLTGTSSSPSTIYSASPLATVSGSGQRIAANFRANVLQLASGTAGIAIGPIGAVDYVKGSGTPYQDPTKAYLTIKWSSVTAEYWTTQGVWELDLTAPQAWHIFHLWTDGPTKTQRLYIDGVLIDTYNATNDFSTLNGTAGNLSQWVGAGNNAATAGYNLYTDTGAIGGMAAWPHSESVGGVGDCKPTGAQILEMAKLGGFA